MRVYIQTDIEGVAGMTFFENRSDDSYENSAHRQRMRRLLTAEVNAAATASFRAGADLVLINDNHGSGYNIIFEELDSRCEIIHGRNASGPSWLPELDGSFDALVLIGMHPMAGTPFGILQHTCWDVNGGKVLLSEASCAAALAGDVGVPAIFVSGDDLLTGELKEKIPSITAVAVKRSISPYMARSIMPGTACKKIHDGVRSALKNRTRVKPYMLPGPVSLNLIASEKGNHDQSQGYRRVLDEDERGATLSEALLKFMKKMSWCSLGLQYPDGFKYP